jgi:hypothetical protein
VFTAVKVSWFILVGLHLLPAVSAFSSSVLQRLYGLAPTGDLVVLLAHRGVLFCAVALACLFGALDPMARRSGSVIVGVSMLGYLVLYLRAGAPHGPLRSIAIADAIGLLPWAVVVWDAWAHRTHPVG